MDDYIKEQLNKALYSINNVLTAMYNINNTGKMEIDTKEIDSVKLTIEQTLESLK